MQGQGISGPKHGFCACKEVPGGRFVVEADRSCAVLPGWAEGLKGNMCMQLLRGRTKQMVNAGAVLMLRLQAKVRRAYQRSP